MKLQFVPINENTTKTQIKQTKKIEKKKIALKNI
jgi:hypothetical protein